MHSFVFIELLCDDDGDDDNDVVQSADVAEQLKAFVFNNSLIDIEPPQTFLAILDIPEQRFYLREDDEATSLVVDRDLLHCFIDDFKNDRLSFISFQSAAAD